ncbi:hypothetical protein PMAYCL1PPCAC_32154, partial [Pristionchus mayeri]
PPPSPLPSALYDAKYGKRELEILNDSQTIKTTAGSGKTGRGEERAGERERLQRSREDERAGEAERGRKMPGEKQERGSQILNMQSYEAVVCQRRFVAVTTAICWLAVIPLIVALATCSWCIIDFVNTDNEKVHVKLGTWGEWRTRQNSTATYTDWIPHFPAPPESVLRLADASLRHFHRAQAALGAISIFLLLGTNALALYTFSEHRYVYKRLCAFMYVITGVCVYATVEIVSQSVDEWRSDVITKTTFDAFDFEARKKYGYSAYLALGVAAACILAAIAFAYGSHKQKGDHAATVDMEIEDRPMHMGRD